MLSMKMYGMGKKKLHKEQKKDWFQCAVFSVSIK